jgi:uncharacterized protein YggU (UPF0235/DUF167 family)
LHLDGWQVVESDDPRDILTDQPNPMKQISLWVKPGSSRDAIDWDPWRKRWVVSCRAPPTGGRANRAVVILVADWLELPHTAVRWTKAGSSRAKVLSVDGITDVEAARRLRSHIATGTLESNRP